MLQSARTRQDCQVSLGQFPSIFPDAFSVFNTTVVVLLWVKPTLELSNTNTTSSGVDFPHTVHPKGQVWTQRDRRQLTIFLQIQQPHHCSMPGGLVSFLDVLSLFKMSHSSEDFLSDIRNLTQYHRSGSGRYPVTATRQIGQRWSPEFRTKDESALRRLDKLTGMILLNNRKFNYCCFSEWHQNKELRSSPAFVKISLVSFCSNCQ